MNKIFFFKCLALFLVIAGLAGVQSVKAQETLSRSPGQTIYVPAFPMVAIDSRGSSMDLAVTLSIGNSDPDLSIVVLSVEYFDPDGKKLQDLVDQPQTLGPMATLRCLPKGILYKGSGGGASFLVKWKTKDQPALAPVVSSVMIGVQSTQGISLIEHGRVLATESL